MLVTLTDERRKCHTCGRWLSLHKFESKGRYRGRQIRRNVCYDCQYFRERALKPFENDTERTCKICGKTYAINRFDKQGEYQGRIYRRWRCRDCCNVYQRQRYHLKKYGRPAPVRKWQRMKNAEQHLGVGRRRRACEGRCVLLPFSTVG